MKKIILFTLSLFCIMSLQGQTVTVDALCLGGAVNFDLNGMDGTGRNVYSNNDFQLDVRYNAGAMRWEVIGQGGVMDVFYATGTNTFSPNPPDSGTTPWMLVFDGCPLGDTTVTGDGTQSTPGGDPCMDLGGDTDGDGVCDDNDICPGFDDFADADNDNIPDGCDDNPNTPDGIIIDANCLDANQTFTFLSNGNDGNGRNIYSNNLVGLDIIYNGTLGLWEIKAQAPGTEVFFTNAFSSIPNPPDNTTNPWVGTGSCNAQPPNDVFGSNTQDFLGCDIMISSITSTNVDCPGNTTGSITVTATTSHGPITYSISGPVNMSNSTGQFTSLPDGNYSVTASDDSFPDTGIGACNDAGSESILVLDMIPPMITCPTSITTNTLLGTCSGQVPDLSSDVNASDNCVSVFISQSPAVGTAFGTQDGDEVIVTVTATDGSGNETPCNITVVLNDNEAPSITCPTDMTITTESGVCNGLVPDLTIVASATDNCGTATITQSPVAGSLFGATEGDQIIVILTVDDGNGNTNSCDVTLTLDDNEAPSITCPSDMTITTESGMCYGLVPDLTGLASASDNCGNPTISQSPLAGSTFGTSEGNQIVVMLTADDGNGNTKTCGVTIILDDNENPQINCPADQTINNDPGECFGTVPNLLPGTTATDNCGIPALSQSPLAGTSFGSADGDQVTVTVTANDGNGNTNSCDVVLTLNDNEAPSINCQNITINLDNSGNVVIAASDINNSSSDNCGNLNLNLSQMAFNCDDVGDNSVTLSGDDGNENMNSCTASVTVVDVVLPLVTCMSYDVPLDMNGNASIVPADVIANVDEACEIADSTVAPNSFTAADIGENTVIVSVTDVNGNTGTCEATVTVGKRPVEVTNLGVFSGQYSDEVTVSASIEDDISNTPLAGVTLNFEINGLPAKSGVTNGSGIASVTMTLDLAPTILGNNYTITASFDETALHQAGSDTDPFTVFQEDAVATYTGDYFVSTAGTKSSSATIVLAATIQDITAVGGDPYPGDIRNATVTFVDRANGNAAISPPLPVILINAADMKVGSVVYNYNVDIGNADSETFEIGIVVGNYYTRNNGADDVLVNVSKPIAQNFVTGGGYIILESSAGMIAGDSGSKNNFSVNVKYNKKGTNLKGKFQTLVRRTEGDGIHTYKIKSNNLQSLSVDPQNNSATLSGKANITDVTDPDNPVSVAGNNTFQVNLVDNGEPSINDFIGMTLYKSNGGLWYSSNWDGVQTVEQNLDGGNIQVHIGNNQALSNDTKLKTRNGETLFLDMKVYPNPASELININLNSNVEGLGDIMIYNEVGKLVYKEEISIFNNEIKSINIKELTTGTYNIRVQSDNGLYTNQKIIIIQ